MLGKAAASSLLLLLLWQGTAAVAFVAWCPLPSGRSTASTPSALVAATTTFTGRDDRGGWCLLSSLHPRPPSRPSMSINDITPTNGLTTGPGGVQRGGGGGGGLEPESHLFIHAPTLTRPMTDLATTLAGSPHFGDIMGGSEGKGANLLRHFEPLERVVLTANGNLQRVISSYYDSPVTVDIKRCEEVEPAVYEREVSLSVLGREFCVAKSLVVLHCPTCVEAVKKGDVGIGQLFRSLDVLPSFELLNAGRTSGLPANGDGAAVEGNRGPMSTRGRLWRVYDLRSRHVSCRIHEEFSHDLFVLAA